MLASKEKILLYGGSNSGKTHAALQFAQRVIAAGKRVFIIDADDGIAKLITELDEFQSLREADSAGSLRVETVYDWEDSLEAISLLKGFKAARGDLIILEMVNNAWDWAQAQFVEGTKDKTIAEHQLGKAESGRLQFGGLDGRSEWPIIKNLYFAVTTPTLQSPAHVIWTAGAKSLIPGSEKQDIIDMFGSVGVKNDGNSGVHYKMDTVFYLTQKAGQRSYTTVKERGAREPVSNVAYESLFTEYYDMNGLAQPW